MQANCVAIGVQWVDKRMESDRAGPWSHAWQRCSAPKSPRAQTRVDRWWPRDCWHRCGSHSLRTCPRSRLCSGGAQPCGLVVCGSSPGLFLPSSCCSSLFLPIGWGFFWTVPRQLHLSLSRRPTPKQAVCNLIWW